MNTSSLEEPNNLEGKEEPKQKLSQEEAEQKARELDLKITSLGGSPAGDSLKWYIDAYMSGEMRENEMLESVRLSTNNKNSVINFANKFPGKVITPSLLYREDKALLEYLLYSKVSESSSSAVGTTSYQEILGNLFKKAGIEFKWEDLDFRKFEQAKEKHEKLTDAAKKLKDKLKPNQNGQIDLSTISNIDPKLLETLLAYLGKDKNTWSKFFEEYLGKDIKNFSLDNKNENGKSKIHQQLGSKLKVIAIGYSNITPYGIYTKDPDLFKALFKILGNNKEAWNKFLQDYVGEQEASKFEFEAVDLKAIENKKAEDKILKPMSEKLKSLIALVERKEGSGGTITLNSIFKYGRLYKINVFDTIAGVIGTDQEKWTRMFRKFLPNHVNRFSAGNINKASINTEVQKIENLKKLGTSLKSLIDSKGPGNVTTKSIYKYAPGLFSRLEGILGTNSSAWNNFMGKHLGENYKSRFHYTGFSKQEVNSERKISSFKRSHGNRLVSLCQKAKTEKITLNLIKNLDPALHQQIMSVTASNSNNLKKLFQKILPGSLLRKIDTSSAANKAQANEIRDKNNPFPFLHREVDRIKISLKHIKIPTDVKPQFFIDNFPNEFGKIRKELRQDKDKWTSFVTAYFPNLEQKFLWKIPDYQDNNQNYLKGLNPEKIQELSSYEGILAEILKRKSIENINSDLELKEIFEEYPEITNKIQNLIGNTPGKLGQYIENICKKNAISMPNLISLPQENLQETKEPEQNSNKDIKHELRLLISDITLEKTTFDLQDIYDRDPELFEKWQETLKKQERTFKDYIEENFPEKIAQIQTEVEPEKADDAPDVFNEDSGEDYSEEKEKTLEAVSKILSEEKEKEGTEGQRDKEREKNEGKSKIVSEAEKQRDKEEKIASSPEKEIHNNNTEKKAVADVLMEEEEGTEGMGNNNKDEENNKIVPEEQKDKEEEMSGNDEEQSIPLRQGSAGQAEMQSYKAEEMGSDNEDEKNNRIVPEAEGQRDKEEIDNNKEISSSPKKETPDEETKINIEDKIKELRELAPSRVKINISRTRNQEEVFGNAEYKDQKLRGELLIKNDKLAVKIDSGKIILVEDWVREIEDKIKDIGIEEQGKSDKREDQKTGRPEDLKNNLEISSSLEKKMSNDSEKKETINNTGWQKIEEGEVEKENSKNSKNRDKETETQRDNVEKETSTAADRHNDDAEKNEETWQEIKPEDQKNRKIEDLEEKTSIGIPGATIGAGIAAEEAARQYITEKIHDIKEKLEDKKTRKEEEKEQTEGRRQKVEKNNKEDVGTEHRSVQEKIEVQGTSDKAEENKKETRNDNTEKNEVADILINKEQKEYEEIGWQEMEIEKKEETEESTTADRQRDKVEEITPPLEKETSTTKDRLNDNAEKTESLDKLIQKLEEIINKNLFRKNQLNAQWFKENHAELYIALLDEFEGNEEKINKLIQNHLQKLNKQRQNNEYRQDSRVNRRKRRLLKRKRLVEEKEVQTENENEKAKSTTNLKNQITGIAKSLDSNIILEFFFPIQLENKKAQRLERLIQKLKENLSKIKSFGATVNKLSINSHNYSEYLDSFGRIGFEIRKLNRI